MLQDYGVLEEELKSVLDKNPKFHLTKGKKVMEIRPSIKWNKGDAVEYLLDTLGFAKSSDVLPLYIGDDRTDEDAFKVHIYIYARTFNPLMTLIIYNIYIYIYV